MKKFFFTKIRSQIYTQKRQEYLKTLFIFKNYISKNLTYFRTIALLSKIKKSKKYYENVISEIRKMIEEKTELISKMEIDTRELHLRYENNISITTNISEENEQLRKKIINLENKIESDNKRFKELWSQNVSDIRSI